MENKPVFDQSTLLDNPYSWHLVQRLTTAAGPKDATIKSIVRHDYMGSAEFEWGAIPASWQKLRALATSGHLGLWSFPMPSKVGEVMHVISSTEVDRERLILSIKHVMGPGYRGKESASAEWLFAEKERPWYSDRTIGWLRVSDTGRKHDPVVWTVDPDVAFELFARVSDQTDQQPLPPTRPSS